MKIKAHTSLIGNTGYNSHSRNFFTHLDKLIPIKVRNFTTGENWNGQMAIVRVYNRDISESEILYNWHTNRGRFGI